MLERIIQKVPLWLLLLFPPVAALLLYAEPALVHEFVTLDDGLLITKNPAVMAMTPQTLWYVFTHYDPELYIPLTFLSYQVDHLLWGLNPVGFHLSNLLLHAGSAAALAYLTLRLTGSRLMAIVVSLLFALHPLNTEAVLWAAARKDLLSTFLGLLSCITFLRYRESAEKKWYRLTVMVFVLALLAKVSVVILPLLFFLYDRVTGRRSGAREYAPLGALMALFVTIALIGKTAVLQSSGPATTMLLAMKSALFYFQSTVWPQGLTVIYPQATPVTFTGTEFLLPLIVVLGTLAAAAVLWKKKPAAAALILLYFIALAPNSTNFLKNGMLFFASDRYAYIAAIAVFSAVAWIIAFLDRRGSAMVSAVSGGVAVLILLILCLVSTVQAGTWRDSEALYRRVLAVYPQSALAWNNLGDVLMKAGRKEEAMSAFDSAVAADSGLIAAHLNRGDAYRVMGRLPEAEAELRIAVDLAENKTIGNLEELGAYYFLGRALDEAGKTDEALAMFARAVERLPQAAEPHYNLGIMLQKHGRTEEALLEFLRTVKLEPLYIAGWYHAAGILAEQGKLEEAEIALERVVELDPGYEKAMEHLKGIRAMRAQ